MISRIFAGFGGNLFQTADEIPHFGDFKTAPSGGQCHARAVCLFLVLFLTLVLGTLPAAAGDRLAQAGDGRDPASSSAWETILRWLAPAVLLDALGAGLDPFGGRAGDPTPPETDGSGEGDLGAGLDPFG